MCGEFRIFGCAALATRESDTLERHARATRESELKHPPMFPHEDVILRLIGVSALPMSAVAMIAVVVRASAFFCCVEGGNA